MKWVVCDIDGTISKVGDRLKYIQKNPKDWDSFYNSCFEDEPIQEMCDLIDNLNDCGYRIVFITGRREQVRSQTEKWIKKHINAYRPFLGEHPVVYMRPNNNHKEDFEVKPVLLENFIYDFVLDNYDIAFILEDRQSVVDKWRSLGYRCLQVDKGDF